MVHCSQCDQYQVEICFRLQNVVKSNVGTGLFFTRKFYFKLKCFYPIINLFFEIYFVFYCELIQQYLVDRNQGCYY